MAAKTVGQAGPLTEVEEHVELVSRVTEVHSRLLKARQGRVTKTVNRTVVPLFVFRRSVAAGLILATRWGCIAPHQRHLIICGPAVSPDRQRALVKE